MARSQANPEAVGQFHLAAVKTLLRLLKEQKIETMDELRNVRGQQLLKEAIWKYNERAGKHATEYVSEGVKRIEEALGIEVSHAGEAWADLEDSAFELEHVDELNSVVQDLLRAGPENSDAIVKSVRTCVVLESEHRRLAKGVAAGGGWGRYEKAKDGPVGVWSKSQKQWIVKPSKHEADLR